jgi:hypothetical protein
MGTQPDNFDDDWQGLEPEPPGSGQPRAIILAAVVVALAVVGICLVSVVVLVGQFRQRTTAGVQLATITPIAVTTAETPLPEATAVVIAPAATNTLPAPIGAVAGAVAGAVSAVRLPAPPTLDGDLAEWAGVAAVQSSFLVYRANSWDGSADLQATWQLGWDNTNLYLGVAVSDDRHVQTQTGNQIFRGDSLDIQFDTERIADFGTGLSPDDYQITLSPGDFAGLPPSAFRFQGTGDGRILDAPGGNRVTLTALQTTTGYNLEAAIPWSDLGLVPEAGLTIGLALNASDDDTPGTAVQEVMMSNMPGRTLTNPTTWGTLTLQ